MNRRNILIALGIVVVAAAAGGGYWLTRSAPAPQIASTVPGAPDSDTITLAEATGGVPLYKDEHILGNPKAPITIVEYASLTCPHCAHFHDTTLPEIKKNWIDTGKARLVFRHYPLDKLALRAAAVADCIKGDGFFGFIGVLFENQAKWAYTTNPMDELKKLAALAGLSPDEFEACANNEKEINLILKRQTDGRDIYSVTSTPSFIINGTPIVGAQDYSKFNSVLEAAAAKSS